MQRPWLSAIIPSYNGDRWFAATLESLAAQGDPGLEIIVVDASDTDESLRITRQFSNRLGIRTYRRPDLSSWMVKTNFGVEQATADWICVLHKDDLWLPRRCEAVAAWVSAQPDSVMHLHPAYIIDAAGNRLGLWRCPLPDGDRPVPAPLFLERLLVQNFIAAPTPTIRRTAYLEAGGMDDQLWYTGDWDLYLKLLETGDVYYHDKALACYRVHGNSLTMSGSHSLDEFRNQMNAVVDRHIGRLGGGQRETLRLAMTSIDVNVALAAASQGKPGRLLKALAMLCWLGPRRMVRYLRYSRIIERAYPRLRARLAGAL